MTSVLAVVASLVMWAGYWEYNRPVLQSNKTPDLVPWTIWGFNGILNAATYRAGTKNPVMSLANEASALANVATLLIAIWMGGKSRRLSGKEWRIVLLGICCIAASKLSPFFGNGFAIVAATIGILPIWDELRVDPLSQKIRPWALWTLAFGVNLVVALVEFRHYIELFQPAYYFALHAVTLLMTAPEEKLETT